MIAIGVDVSTGRIAFGDSLGGHESILCLTAQQEPDEAVRLADIYHRAGVVARQFANERPCVVFVEQPAGHVVPLNLIRMVGVVMGGIAAAGFEVRPVAVSTWKLHGVGHGHSTKTQVLRWARARGYTGECPKCDPVRDVSVFKCKRASEAHDVADALGIAAAGAVLLGLEDVAA